MSALQAHAPLGAVAVAVLTLAAGEARAQWGSNNWNVPSTSEVALIQTLQSSPDPGQRQHAARRLGRFVDRWYQHFLRRPADPQGLAAQVAAMRQGSPAEDVLASLVGSDEYFRLNGSYVPGWISAMYRDVFGRSPRPDEVQSWMQALAQMGGNRQETAKAFLRSARQEAGGRGWLFGN